MNRSLLSLLTIALLWAVAVAMPVGARGATVRDNDYVRIGVPDLSQAVGFFRDVLNCQLIGSTSAAGSAVKGKGESRLLACESNSIVELFDNHAAERSSPPRQVSRGDNEPIQFVLEDIAHAGQWLTRSGVRVVGFPHKLSSGPLAGMTVVNFVSPWGLQLQLAGWETDVATAGR
jgi:catechol 2,3-dioxygenase-like lactoylglutathione lyase family enzyme